ncbi:Protein phosphatase 2C domain-containing protein OS=Streptomyces violarus OX=67380 GN=FHS41_002265 PE=4 SV=1 [Streptomyces violarus]
MRTELASEPGDADRPNEDFASVGLPASGQGGSVVVLDGVTPPKAGTGCLHSVPWFTARLGER